MRLSTRVIPAISIAVVTLPVMLTTLLRSV